MGPRAAFCLSLLTAGRALSLAAEGEGPDPKAAAGGSVSGAGNASSGGDEPGRRFVKSGFLPCLEEKYEKGGNYDQLCFASVADPGSYIEGNNVCLLRMNWTAASIDQWGVFYMQLSARTQERREKFYGWCLTQPAPSFYWGVIPETGGEKYFAWAKLSDTEPWCRLKYLPVEQGDYGHYQTLCFQTKYNNCTPTPGVLEFNKR